MSEMNASWLIAGKSTTLKSALCISAVRGYIGAN